jgi:hypothetical protein
MVSVMYVMIGGRRENTRDYVVPRSFKSRPLVGVDSFVYRKICVAVRKSISKCQSQLPLHMLILLLYILIGSRL